VVYLTSLLVGHTIKPSRNCVVSQRKKNEMMSDSRRLGKAFDGAHLTRVTNYYTRYLRKITEFYADIALYINITYVCYESMYVYSACFHPGDAHRDMYFGWCRFMLVQHKTIFSNTLTRFYWQMTQTLSCSRSAAKQFYFFLLRIGKFRKTL
jgi:hypothetical protein